MTMQEPRRRDTGEHTGTTAPHGEPPLKTRPLSDALGLEVLDVDLREPLSPARIAQLRDA